VPALRGLPTDANTSARRPGAQSPCLHYRHDRYCPNLKGQSPLQAWHGNHPLLRADSESAHELGRAQAEFTSDLLERARRCTAAARSFFFPCFPYLRVHPPVPRPSRRPHLPVLFMSPATIRSQHQCRMDLVRSSACLFVALVLAAGCATTTRKPPSDRYVRYRCADKQEFAVTYQQNATRALLELGGWSHLLRSDSVAPGTHYSGSQLTLRLEPSGTAVLRVGEVTHDRCVVIGTR
jgi:hypothetical protein